MISVVRGVAMVVLGLVITAEGGSGVVVCKGGNGVRMERMGGEFTRASCREVR